MPIVHNNVNSTSIINSSNNESENINENFREDSEDGYKKRVFYIYNTCKMTSLAILHTFLLSIFETVFYWLYVTKQERLALIRRLNDFKFIFDVICITSDNDDVKNIIQEYIDNSDKERKVNNEGPFRTSLILIIVLFISSLISLFITLLIKNLLKDRLVKYERKKVSISFFSKEYFLNIANSIPLFLFISIYEFLFFQMVIYYYQPISSHEMITTLASNCIS